MECRQGVHLMQWNWGDETEEYQQKQAFSISCLTLILALTNLTPCSALMVSPRPIWLPSQVNKHLSLFYFFDSNLRLFHHTFLQKILKIETYKCQVFLDISNHNDMQHKTEVQCQSNITNFSNLIFLEIRCTHNWVLSLQPLLQENLQVQPAKPNWPDTQYNLCSAAEAVVPYKGGPKSCHQHGPNHTSDLWQCLLPKSSEGYGSVHLWSGAVYRHKIKVHCEPICSKQCCFWESLC